MHLHGNDISMQSQIAYERFFFLFPQVPSFNGSSYLRYPGLADTSLSWLELSVTLKPTAQDGVILYNGHHSDATGDFIALYLSSGHVQFTFDLGTGPATLR